MVPVHSKCFFSYETQMAAYKPIPSSFTESNPAPHLSLTPREADQSSRECITSLTALTPTPT